MQSLQAGVGAINPIQFTVIVEAGGGLESAEINGAGVVLKRDGSIGAGGLETGSPVVS